MSRNNPNTQNNPVQIDQVRNGFIVSQRDLRRGDCAVTEDHVFQTFAELVNHLAAHFTHRADGVASDKVDSSR